MKSHLPRTNLSTAFTLLELLVVLFVLALLAMIMVPALARTNPDTKGLLCLNHMRQLAGAMMMYTHDNHDLFPPNPDDGNKIPGYIWCIGQGGTGGGDEFNPDLLKDPQRTLLAKYTKND